MKCLKEFSFDAKTLYKDYPIKWDNPNKQIVFDRCFDSDKIKGKIDFKVWNKTELPTKLSFKEIDFQILNGIFDYKDNSKLQNEIHWYLNFADPDLFISYNTDLMAQDEIQVLEHPILGSIREYLLDHDFFPETVDMAGNPTPVTITNVQRFCHVNTIEEEVGFRVYGNEFSKLQKEQVIKAVKKIDPPTVSHILAMAAPLPKKGFYSESDINYILTTAYTGFFAVKIESAQICPGKRVYVNTGFWGCGAFGGNKFLMTLLQILVAELAGVNLLFYTFSEKDMEIAKKSYEYYKQLKNGCSFLNIMISQLVKEKFEWNIPDGN